MTKFQKGQGGRKPGKPNKATTDLRQWINDFIDSNLEQIQQDWKALEPKERITLFEKLLRYSLPTLQAVSTEISYERLTDEQLDEIVNRLKEAD